MRFDIFGKALRVLMPALCAALLAVSVTLVIRRRPVSLIRR